MGDKKQLSGLCYPSHLLRLPVLPEPPVGLSHALVEPNCHQGSLLQALSDETSPRLLIRSKGPRGQILNPASCDVGVTTLHST